jgi:hypothetical protein
VAVQDECCQISDPVCGCDGTTYLNDCERVKARVHKDHSGACPDSYSRSCGGFVGKTCIEGYYCEMQDDTCNLADLVGVCTEVPEMCTREIAPVCGCNGETYSNDCLRRVAGTSLSHVGACEVPIPECLTDCLEVAGGLRDSDRVEAILQSLGADEATYAVELKCDSCCRRQCLEDVKQIWKTNGIMAPVSSSALEHVTSALDDVCSRNVAPMQVGAGSTPLKLLVVATEEFFQDQLVDLGEKVRTLSHELEDVKACKA